MKISPRLVFSLCIFLIIAIPTIIALQWPWGTKIFPLTIGTLGSLFALIQLGKDLYRGKKSETKNDFILDLSSDQTLPADPVIRRAATYFAWLFFLFTFIVLFGFFPATVSFLVLYALIHTKMKWYNCVLFGVIVFVLTVLFFDQVLHLPWPQGIIIRWLGLG